MTTNLLVPDEAITAVRRLGGASAFYDIRTESEAEVQAVATPVVVAELLALADKAGEPYIGHVARVAARLDDPLDRAVAWLHDVIEDCPGWDYQRLVWGEERTWTDHEYETWRRICMDVEKLTHRLNEPRTRYYERVALSPRAVRVKLADIADNADPERLARVDNSPPTFTRDRLTEKYRKAREALGAEVQT